MLFIITGEVDERIIANLMGFLEATESMEKFKTDDLELTALKDDVPAEGSDKPAYYFYFGGIWGGQLQRYRDNKALENACLPSGDEPALPSRVERLADDMLLWIVSQEVYS